MAYLTTQTTTQNSFTARLSAAFDTVATYFKQRRLYRETFDGLNALTNRELADLGLTRSELRTVALESSRNAVR